MTTEVCKLRFARLGDAGQASNTFVWDVKISRVDFLVTYVRYQLPSFLAVQYFVPFDASCTDAAGHDRKHVNP